MESATEIRPLFRKFHSVPTSGSFGFPFAQFSFALVFIGENQIWQACSQLDTFGCWPEDMMSHESDRMVNGKLLTKTLKIYQPALAVEEALIFVPYQSNEDFCELTIRKSPNTQIVCYRLEDFGRDECGERVKIESRPFGFGLPHPTKKGFQPDPNHVRLVEHRPGSDATWLGFEPVWLKTKREGEDGFSYFRLQLDWDEQNYVLGLVVTKLPEDSGAIPTTLKDFINFRP